jgi:K+ transporter
VLYIKACYAHSLFCAVAQVLKPHFLVAVLLAYHFTAFAAVVLTAEEVELLGADLAELGIRGIPAWTL